MESVFYLVKIAYRKLDLTPTFALIRLGILAWLGGSLMETRVWKQE